MATNDQDHDKEIDSLSGVETTGHNWDGIKELNNPAPRWWLWVFFLCVIFSVGYWIYYPSWPTLSGFMGGKGQWSEYAKLKDEQSEIVAMRAALDARIDKASLEEIQKTPELYEFARSAGLAAFRNNCAACHGQGAQGSKGYPNLTDDVWIWGGTLDQIVATIRVGVRSTHAETLQSAMPAWGKDGLLSRKEIDQLATYVENLHKGDRAEQTADFINGRELYAANCTVCHGEKGEGNPALGSPPHNTRVWLFGGDHASIVESITYSRAGVMPSWEGRLDDRTIKELAIYVHSLGGGL